MKYTIRKARNSKGGAVCACMVRGLCPACLHRGNGSSECHRRYQTQRVMKYTIRKGLETPCKIRGLLSYDYWMLVGALGGYAILAILGLRNGIISGEWNMLLLSILLCISTIPVLYKKFKKNARIKKFDETRREFTISNFEITKILSRKK